MKKVLILTYYFPPANAVPSYRALSWANHFQQSGLYPVIVTRHWTGNEKLWADFLKDSNEKITHEIHSGYEIFRLPSGRFSFLTCFRNSLFKIPLFSKAFFFLTHFFGRLNYISNADHAFRKFLVNHLKESKYDLILATSPPLNIIRLASFLNKKFDIPYVVDFRDLYNNAILDENFNPVGLHAILQKRTVKYLNKWLKNASFCTAVSLPIADMLGKIFLFERHVILNGFDDEIFQELVKLRQPYFSIVLSGTYYDGQGIDLIVKGLNKFLIDKHPCEIKISFIGLTANKKVADYFRDNIDSDFTIWYDRMPMRNAMQHVKNADVLMHSAFKGLKGVYTTKLFDFIASGNNILLTPGDKGVMEDLINKINCGKIADHEDDIAAILNAWFSEWKLNGEVKCFSNDLSQLYSRKSQSEIMAGLINKLFNIPVEDKTNVLILSYYFPPCTGAPAWRANSWAEHFPKFNLVPTIITRNWTGKENKWKDYLSDNIKPGSYRQFNSYEVYYLPTKRYSVLTWLNQSMFRSIIGKPVYAYMIFKGHINPEVDADLTFHSFVSKLIKRKRFDVVIISTPPPNILRLTKIFKNTNVKVIADFRDLWNNNLMNMNYHPGFKFRFFDAMARFHHRRWLKNVDLITGIVPAFKEVISKVAKKEMQVFYNGYEKNIFDNLTKTKSVIFRFTCVGSIYPQQDLSIMINGLKKFIENKTSDDLIFRFIGLSSIPDVADFIQSNIPSGFLEITARVSKEEAIYYTKNSEILFYPGWKGSRGMISTKAFDYIASGNHILIAPGDESALDELISTTETGFIANSTAEFFSFVESKYIEWKKVGEISVIGNQEKIDFYSRETQAKYYAESIKKLISNLE